MQDSLTPFGQEVEQRPAEVLESRLDGAFRGYSGRTRFRLLNGQVWEQESFSCIYRYAYMPQATIFRSGDDYYMRIEGVPGAIPVRRVG